MMTTFTMLMMLIALHLSPLLQQSPVVIVMVATVSHDQSRDQALTLRLLQVKKTFDDSFQAAQDPQTLKKYSSLKQTPENNWQGFKSWDRLVCLGLSASLPHEYDQTECKPRHWH